LWSFQNSPEFRACRASCVKGTGRPEAWANRNDSRAGASTQTEISKLLGTAGQRRPASTMVAKARPRGTSLRCDAPDDSSQPGSRSASSPFGCPPVRAVAGSPGPSAPSSGAGDGRRPSMEDRGLGDVMARWLFVSPGWRQREADARSGQLPWHQTRSAPASARLIPPLTSTRAWGTR